jgi:SAM-dependent methyltransferase
MKSLKDLYKNHSGKVSDKWTIYLEQYDEKLKKYQDLPIKLLEIGVLNGGSLEIFSKYFSNAKLILGCDIDPKCKNLKYNKDENIILINGDVNDSKTKEIIVEHSKFDIILDDGSHNSDDVVKTFCNYFNYLKDGGLYIIEDLHCSYWREHKGGIFFPISSMNFLKKLIDIVNHEHWGIKKNKEWLLKGFLENYKINIEKLDLESINSIEFINSLCFIKKEASKDNKLGKRIVVGQEAIVVPDRKKLNNLISKSLNQEVNPWSNSELLPEQELVLSQKKLKQFEEKIHSLEKEIEDLKNK